MSSLGRKRSGGLNHLTRHMLGEDSYLGDEVLVFSVLPLARHPQLSDLVSVCTWPIVLLWGSV